MTRKVSIIMYHYIYGLKHSCYPKLKGLSAEVFEEQLKYIIKNYHIITMEELITAVKSRSQLAQNALLLTFDDGYLNHFMYAFSILDKMGIQGCFFPSVKAIGGHEILGVHKIHFLLACVSNIQRLIKDINLMLNQFRSEYKLKDNKYYFQRLAVANRFDSKEIIFVKRLLQKELPEELRQKILKQLFDKYVTKDEIALAKEFYMDIDQLMYMKKNGMYIGVQGFNHCWLGTLSEEMQNKNIDSCLQFLQKIGCSLNDWAMCYAYGAYNDSLLSMLERKGCAIGLTTKIRIANLDIDNPLTLPRLDTRDLPKDSNF